MNARHGTRGRISRALSVNLGILLAIVAVTIAVNVRRVARESRERQRAEQQIIEASAAEAERVARDAAVRQARADSLLRILSPSTVRAFSQDELDIAQIRAGEGQAGGDAFLLLQGERERRVCAEAREFNAAMGRERNAAFEEQVEKRTANVLASVRGYQTAGQITRSRVESLLRKFPDLSDDALAQVAAGRVFLGMTGGQLRESIGSPQDINRTVGSWGVHEQWVYGSFPDNFYVYLEDGLVTSWQD